MLANEIQLISTMKANVWIPGYGDSDGSPTEEGITADARVVYEYVRSVAGLNVVIIWGHSMGTG